MATVNDIIQRTRRELGIQDYEEPITAVDAAIGLNALNSMLARWKLQGIIATHTNYATQAAAVTLDFGGTAPVADGIEEPLAACLVKEISAQYDAPLTPKMIMAEQQGFSTIFAQRLLADPDHTRRGPDELAIMPSQRRMYLT